MNFRLLIPSIALAALSLGDFWLRSRTSRRVLTPEAAAAALADAETHLERSGDIQPILDALRAELNVHRQLVVLFSEEEKLQGAARSAVLHHGQRLHHQDQAMVYHLDAALSRLAMQPPPQRDPLIGAILDWMEKDPELLECDRLAFRDPLRTLQQELLRDTSPEGNLLKARISRALMEVDRIESKVDAEYRQVFGGAPAKGGERRVWLEYVRALKTRLPQVQTSPAPQPYAQAEREIDGRELPDKVLILSFDDGPHRLYTEEIKAILQRYRAPALFFEVGRNLGTVDGVGHVKLGPLSDLTEDLVKSGFVIGNHSYSHAQLSKETGKPLELEIGETDQLLTQIPGAHSHLFRFPYGARTPVQMQVLQVHNLRSVLWNIDSLDWADPVPSSVMDRVLRGIAQERRGIILFHDIHDRAVKVLPQLLERLQAEGYRFGGLDANGELMFPK